MKIKGLKKIRKTEALGMFFIMVGSALNFPVAIWAENIESPEACVVTTERENEPEASDNVMKSGICGVAGDNVRWTLDDKGILTISGSGDALDYASVSDAPWALNDETVECPIISIVIDTGVTNVGAYSFSGHSCTDVRIADSVIKIGSNIFETWDSIQTIYYHGTQKQWEDSVQVGENNTGWIEKLTFHTHTADSAWESDKTHHWHNCIDPDCPTTDIQWKDSYGQHKWEAGGCLDCGFQCEHDEGNEEWIKTAVSHEKRWNCCGAVIVAEEVHEWNSGICEECGYVCEHTGGLASCTEQAICQTCGEAYGELASHDWEDDFTIDQPATCTEDGVKSIHCKNCTATKDSEVIQALDHNLEKIEKEEATCTEGGYEGYWSCTNCQKLFADEGGTTEILSPVEIPAYGHALEKAEKKEATCTEGGYESYWKCKTCQKLFADEGGTTEIISPVEISAQGHALEKTEKKEATCVEPGYESYWKCKTCQKLFADEGGTTEILSPVEIPAQGHALEKAEKKEATCTEGGYESYWKCKTCQKLFADEGGTTEILSPVEIPAYGHALEKTERKEATCTEGGYESYWKCKTCQKLFADEGGTTEILSPVEIPAYGHALEKTEKKEGTCVKPGYESYWKCKTCQKLFADEGGTTEISGAIEIPSQGHVLEKTERKEATCTEGGYESYWKCKTCQKLFADEGGITEISEPIKIPSQGHVLEKTERKEATCTEGGYESYWKCKTCQKFFADEGGTTEISEPIKIPSQGHVLEKTERKEATCTERGYESYWKCKTCQKLFADEGGTKEISSPVEISAQGHALEKTEKKEATCVEPGYEEYYTCRVCGKLYQDKEGINEIGSLDTIKISAEGHKGGENWLLNADKHWKECAVCQKRIEEADHIYENEKDSACKICGYKRAIKSESPRIIDGYNEKWQVNSGKTLSFCSSAPFSEFINVTIDNEVVNENNYDKKEGSTIITLHSEFLSALSVGVHTLSINSESGSATTGFVIEKAPLEPSPTVEPSPTDAPSIVAASSVVTATPTPTTAPEETNTKTGDESKIIIWILVLFLSAEGILIILQKFKKKTR